MKNSIPRLNRGFSVLPILLIIIIVGAASAFSQLHPQSIEQRSTAFALSATKQMNDTRDTMLGFAAVNRRLPRPATSATNGAENPAACADVTACTGITPWVTLGTPVEINYIVRPELANAAITCDAATPFPFKSNTTTLSVGATVVQIPNTAFCSHIKKANPLVYPNCDCS